MAIEYREWRDGDDLALLEIWGDPETDQAGQFRGTLAPSGNAPWRRCIVAEDVVDGVAIPVAAGVVHEASLHPERLWVYVEVARDHRRAGIGSTLLMKRHSRLKRNSKLAPKFRLLNWLKSGQKPALKVRKVLRPICQPAAICVGTSPSPLALTPGRISIRSIGTPKSWISARSSSLESALEKYASPVSTALDWPSWLASFAG